MIKGLRLKETFEDATRSYERDHPVQFPNRIAVQALASVEMSRVVQQDLEEMSRNAHLEHERQGQLLALGRAGVPGYVAKKIPGPGEANKLWGVINPLTALARSGAAIGRGVARFVAGEDDSTTDGGGGAGAGSSVAPPFAGAGSSVAPQFAPSVDAPRVLHEKVARLDTQLQELQEKDSSRRAREEAEQLELASQMQVDEVGPAAQQHVQNIFHQFQQNFNILDQRQMNFSAQQFSTTLRHNVHNINPQYNMNVDQNIIYNEMFQNARRGDVQTIAVDEHGHPIIGPALQRDPRGYARAKPVAKGNPKRKGHAITAGTSAAAAAAAPSGAGTLAQYERPTSGASASASGTNRAASGGATLVIHKLGKTAQGAAHAAARAKAKAKKDAEKDG